MLLPPRGERGRVSARADNADLDEGQHVVLRHVAEPERAAAAAAAAVAVDACGLPHAQRRDGGADEAEREEADESD